MDEQETNDIRKTSNTTVAACAVDLGARTINKMVGDSISKADYGDLIEVMAAAINVGTQNVES